MSTSSTNHDIKLKRATIENVDEILEIEKNLEGIKTYSALTKREEVIEEISNHIMYLIKQDAKTVGDTSYQIKNKHHAYISGLGIVPEFQGKGIGRQAIKLILEELKDVKLIDLVTHPDNEAAVNLYASFGFKQSGERQENYFGDGEPRIRMVLEKSEK